ncbi:MAG TPA: zinc ribbon domain-containing protein [Bacteroidota bacterium]|nr:zinc ribbon domain-containing protein [Bacteroidota bacterium]
MPTYGYLCKHCGHEFEELQSMSEPPLVRCPKCGTDNLARVMGTGGALIFKGSGFYLTDYKKTGKSESQKPEAKKQEKKDSGDAKSPPATPPPSPPKKET